MLTLAALVAGCGSDDEENGSAQTRTQPQTQTQERSATSDETQVRELASRYLEAFKKRDWKAVCATLSPKARQRFARKAGSCPAVYRQAATGPIDKYLLVSEVHVDGDRATVELNGGGVPGAKAEEKYYAAKIDGKWWLYIKRAAKGAP